VTAYEWVLLAFQAASALGLLVSLGAGYYAWQVKRQQLRKEEVDEKVRRVHDRVDARQGEIRDLTDRVSRAEKHLEDVPSASSVHELALSISGVSGDMKSVMAQMEGMREIVTRQERVTTRLEDYMRQVDRERRGISA